MTIWYVDVHELRAGTISDRCATGSSWAAVGVEDVRRVDIWIHAHRLRRRNQHSLALNHNDFWYIVRKDEADRAHSASFVIRENVVDVEFVHDLCAIFTGFIREHALLVGAIIFQMVALTRWHCVAFEVVLASWLHIDAPFFPAQHNAFRAAHHLAQHRRVLPRAAFHAFVDLRDHTFKIVAVFGWDVTHEVVVAAAARTTTARVSFFCDQHIHALTGSRDRAHQPGHAAADDQILCFDNFVTNLDIHYSAPPVASFLFSAIFSSDSSIVNIMWESG